MYFRNVLSYTGSGFQTLSGSHPNIGQVPHRALGWDGGIPHNSDRSPNQPRNDTDPEMIPIPLHVVSETDPQLNIS